jgi:putative two-component system response regulator
MQVLVVDDDDFALSIVADTMTNMGYAVVTAHNGRQAMEILHKGEIRLVITDWDMPEMNGIELCRAARREDIPGYVYMIMLTGREGAKQRMEGLCAGADDFLNKPLDPDELLVCLKTAERILALETRDVALFALAKLAESRDYETGAHIERVQGYARAIARHLSEEYKAHYGVDDEYIRLLYQTSPLHDLGKVGIPDAVLLKPGKLTNDEFAVMKTHTLIGAQTLDAALQRFPNTRFLQFAREIAATHHEKYDGTGYPLGLAGEQIPLCGRIVAVADVYDALTSRRVYKDAVTHEQAMAVIRRDRGTHFDPEVVDAFLRAQEQILALRERWRDDVAATAKQRAVPLPPAVLGQMGPNPCKILVVEDDSVMLARLNQLLSATGQPVFIAADGQEALQIISEHAPRVVVSDWVMPRIDGVELCRLIRSRPSPDPVHFIMLTAHSNKSRLLDAYEAGVDDFLSKPFDTEELLARVRAGIRTAKLNDELSRKASGSEALNAQLATLNSRLERLAITDELTGLFNRRHAMSRLQEQWALGDRYGQALSVAMIDIDHFKAINDQHGHDAGDVILRTVANILRAQTRGTDVVCRVGGEEFLIIFPLQTAQEARVCAERCRLAIAENKFNDGVSVTISVGLADRGREMSQFPDLLKAADQALYAAKRAGRNLVCVADEVNSSASASSTPVPSAAAQPAGQTPPLPTEAPMQLQPKAPPIDTAALLKRCGGDLKFAAAVTARFQTQAGPEVDKIAKNLEKQDAEAVHRTAHSLKSMTAYMGADTASGLARQIEELGHAKKLAEIEPLLTQLREEISAALTWISQSEAASAIRSA